MVQHCIVTSCKVTSHNKPPDVTFHSCPRYKHMRVKWYNILRSRCLSIDWANSQICSKHFDKKYFDSKKNLKDNAIPTLFSTNKIFIKSTDVSSQRRIDLLLSRMPEPELVANIKRSLLRINEPPNIEKFIATDLSCLPGAPNEVEMWLLIKKQDRLITRLTEVIAKDRKNELLQTNLKYTKSRKDYVNHSIEKYKYIVKCLQEKLATTEEQIEILTAVEST